MRDVGVGVISSGLRPTEITPTPTSRGPCSECSEKGIHLTVPMGARYRSNRDSLYEGGGKANIALARKLLGIVYRTLWNGWVFEDFPAFRLKDGTIPVWSREGAKKHAASRRDLSLSAKTGKKKRAT